jgi:hypothetical protein
MITILFHMMAKARREEECAAAAKDNGDHASAGPGLWQDAPALNAHVARLQEVFGPPDDQEPYPETHHRRRQPKALLAVFEKTDADRYEALE